MADQFNPDIEDKDAMIPLDATSGFRRFPGEVAVVRDWVFPLVRQQKAPVADRDTSDQPTGIPKRSIAMAPRTIGVPSSFLIWRRRTRVVEVRSRRSARPTAPALAGRCSNLES